MGGRHSLDGPRAARGAEPVAKGVGKARAAVWSHPARKWRSTDGAGTCTRARLACDRSAVVFPPSFVMCGGEGCYAAVGHGAWAIALPIPGFAHALHLGASKCINDQ
eukprot:scaffold11660_cov119-Isochrysis_galbana.AAC.2